MSMLYSLWGACAYSDVLNLLLDESRVYSHKAAFAHHNKSYALNLGNEKKCMVIFLFKIHISEIDSF